MGQSYLSDRGFSNDPSTLFTQTFSFKDERQREFGTIRVVERGQLYVYQYCEKNIAFCTLQKLFHPDISLDDHSIDILFFYFLDAFLDEGIVVDGNGEIKRFAFPVAVAVIIQVFGILITG